METRRTMFDPREDPTSEPLERMLREASRSLPTPEPVADLAGRVRQRWARRRRRRRLAGGVAVAVLAVAVGGGLLWARSGAGRGDPAVAGRNDSADPAENNAAAEIARLRAEIAELRAEAQRLERAAQEARRREQLAERLASLARELGKPDPAVLAQIEYEKTAFLLAHRGESREDLSPAERQAAYRQAATLFPETTWGRIAQKRLDALSPQTP